MCEKNDEKSRLKRRSGSETKAKRERSGSETGAKREQQLNEQIRKSRKITTQRENRERNESEAGAKPPPKAQTSSKNTPTHCPKHPQNTTEQEKHPKAPQNKPKTYHNIPKHNSGPGNRKTAAKHTQFDEPKSRKGWWKGKGRTGSETKAKRERSGAKRERSGGETGAEIG